MVASIGHDILLSSALILASIAGLVTILFMRIDADLGFDLQATDENLGDQDLVLRGRVLGFGLPRYGHRQSPITSGVRHARCWPPSTAIIWPVTEGASIR